MALGSPVASSNPFRSPVSNPPRHVPLLPRPQPAQVLRSQALARLCLVCGRKSCRLESHKRYAEQALTRRRNNHVESPSRDRVAFRSSPWEVRPPDQFIAYPIPMDPERDELLALWSQEWGRIKRGPERHLFPIRWIDLVLPTATKHAPLFHAILAVSASMRTLAYNTMHDVASRNLQLADQALTHWCANQTTASLDECLLASILLTIVYQAQGNAYEIDRRFASVVRLVGSRGGPHYLGMSGIVAEMLMHADHVQASLLNRKPVWTMPLPALKIGVEPRLGIGFRRLEGSGTCHADLLLAADSICRTTDIFEQQPSLSSVESGVSNAFGYLSMISEYQLARCDSMFSGSNTWNECICLALLLFNHAVLRYDGVVTAIIRKFEHRFWTAIDAVIVQGAAEDIPPCLLLWLLMTALSPCVLAESNRYSAIKKMRAAKISAAITSWDHFQASVLDDFVWMRAAQENVFRDTWHDVEGLRNAS